MALRGQNHGVYRSKVWHFWVVTHGVLATPDNGLWLRRTTRLLLRETTDNRQWTTRLFLRKTTSQQDYETTSGAAAGGASQGLRNYGTTDRASRLKAQSLSILSILTAHGSQLTTNCGHALTLRCLLSVDCCP